MEVAKPCCFQGGALEREDICQFGGRSILLLGSCAYRDACACCRIHLLGSGDREEAGDGLHMGFGR